MAPPAQRSDAPTLSDLRSPEPARALATEALGLMRELYPLCRSITGAGLRDTLRRLAEIAPFELAEVPTGTKVLDWEIPPEWVLREAWLRGPDGELIADVRRHSLELVSYSRPFRGRLSLAELRPHLHSDPAHPDWTPYRTSYYRDDWGFCLPERRLAALTEGLYEVVIDTALVAGGLSYAELVIPGSTGREFLIYTHACHPSLCNDNLSGMVAATLLARTLQAESSRLTYRVIVGPGTIGSIAWLATHRDVLPRVDHGLVIGLLGDPGPLTFKRSRDGDRPVDRIAAHALRGFPGARAVDFSPYGYDERQFCSPGFNLPVGRLTRTPNNEYPEYHSSADNFDLISAAALGESLQALATVLSVADRNLRYVNQQPYGEPRLGTRGLYRAVGGQHVGDFEHALLWVLNQSDGTRTLLDIAERAQLPFDRIWEAAAALSGVGLLRAV
ncbi:MAG TPA: DUF4910 domain-containing protein [Steroidobacteraceae bacterium]|nr:DUF4910 domain-containing protein [Steroidobacteraceae bacterium]